MATAIHSKTAAIALLAIGAIWWLSQRRAAAQPLYATPTGANANAAVQRYYLPPSGVVPNVPATPLQSVLNFASSLIGRGASGAAQAPAGAGTATQLQQSMQSVAAQVPMHPMEYQYLQQPVIPPSTLTGGLSNEFSLAGDYKPLDYSVLYGYADGAGVADQVVGRAAPNVDWGSWASDDYRPFLLY